MLETMTNADKFWLSMDHPKNLMIISGFMEFEEKLDFEFVKSTLEERLCVFKRFKQRVVTPISGVGSASWEIDPDFDIRYHVKRVALPGERNQEDLQSLISDLMMMPLDKNKPLWTIHYVENYGKGSAIFIRVHHCIADGMALIYVLFSTTDVKPGIPLFPNKTEEKKKKAPFGSSAFFLRNITGTLDKTQKLGSKLFGEVTKMVTSPSYFKAVAKTTADFAVDAATVLGKLTLMPSDPKTTLKGPLGYRKVVTWTKPISLGNIKIISKAVEATINDILIATVAGALRRYLIEKGDKVNEAELTMAVPVNVRKPGTEFELGNKFALVFLTLPVHVEDPIIRLKEVKRRMDNLKSSPDAMVSFAVLSAIGLSPAGIAKKSASFFANKATAVMTNVPGPKQALYFANKKISNIMFWVPRSGDLGMGISILSYAGSVIIGLVTDENLVPKPELILQDFEKDFHYLFDLVKSGEVFTEPLVVNDRYQDALEYLAKVDSEKKKSEKKPEKVKKVEKVEKEAKNPATKPAKKKVKSAKKPEIVCTAKTKKGTQCKNKAIGSSGLCKVHQKN